MGSTIDLGSPLGGLGQPEGDDEVLKVQALYLQHELPDEAGLLVGDAKVHVLEVPQEEADHKQDYDEGRAGLRYPLGHDICYKPPTNLPPNHPSPTHG